MEVMILAAVVIAAFGAITIGWVLAQGGAKSAAQPANNPNQAQAEANVEQPWAAEARAADEAAASEHAAFDRAAPRPNGNVHNEVPLTDRVVEADRFESITTSPLFVEQRRTDLTLPVNALQLNATDIIAAQIERLQAEYIQLETERERLAQELLTSYLVEKIEGSAGRLRAETKKEAQDLRQQLVKVSTDFERAQFRLASLEHLQDRLDDPRVARQIDELVKFVRQLARER